MIGKDKEIPAVYTKGMYIIVLAISSICIIAALVLTILDLTGNIEWVIEIHGFKSKVTNAPPGIIFLAAGVIILCVFKPVIYISSRMYKALPGPSERLLKLVQKTGKHYRQFPRTGDE